MNTYKYKILDYESEIYKIKSYLDPEDDCWIAEKAAKDYHSNHDGWESRWPLVFQILTQDGTEIGRYSVDRETVPKFSAYPVKETK